MTYGTLNIINVDIRTETLKIRTEAKIFKKLTKGLLACLPTNKISRESRGEEIKTGATTCVAIN